MAIKYRDIEKEKQLLAILLKTKRPDKTEILGKLSPESFTTMVTRETFILIRDYHEKYLAPLNKQIALSLAEKLTGSKKTKVRNFIITIGKLKVSTRVLAHLLEEVLYHEACREVHDILIGAKDIFKQNRDPFIVKDFLMDQITQTQLRTQKDVEILDLKVDFKRRYKEIRKQRKAGITNMGIETGIDKRFDDEISGVNAGDLLIVVGLPSGGKSLMMQDIACYQAVEKEKKIAYVTNEMTAKSVAFRMDARISEIRHRKFKRPATMKKIDFQKWKLSFEDLQRERIKVIGMTGGNCSAASVHAKLKEIGYKPDIIFVDHLNNMIPNSLSGREVVDANFAAASQSILKECKSLALRRKVGVISAGHLKPEAEEKMEVGYSDIALNKQALAMHSDIIIAIVQTKGMKGVKRARLQFLKVREGKTKEYIEVIPDFGIIRINNPDKKVKSKKKKRRRKQ